MQRIETFPAMCLLAVVAGCGGAPVSETIAGASPAGAVWVLEKINDRPVSARTTMRFKADGGIYGETPCNSYSAEQRIPLPWFEAGPITLSRRACDDQTEERRFIAALEDVVFAEIAGNTMLLTGDQGESLLFRLE